MLNYARFLGCVKGDWGDSHYRVLGVKRGCTVADVEQMYRCFLSPNKKQQLAYAVLRDEQRRAVYDDWLTALERSRGWRAGVPGWLWVVVDRYW